MASTPPTPIVGKPSFAKVAAMAPPPKVKPPVSQTKAPHLQPNPNFALQNSTTSSAGTDSCASSKRRTSQGQAREGVATITDGLDKLAVTGEGLSQHPQKEPNTEVVNVANGTEDDRSQLSNSSTKPASFDTKSMASENTFAMEEKESLRPDDSASVQAADEEEPFFVPPVLGKPDSQAAVAINPGLRRPPPDGPVALGSQGRFPMTTMINPPRFGDIVPNVPPHFPQNGAPPIPFAANQNDVSSLQQYSASSIAPDEKIIEALGTPKDRLLLLQLEEKFLAFISQSRDAILDLPPQNSYERLLTHKLADYYSLSRYSPGDSNSIRLYKSAGSGLPVPLAELVRGITGKEALPAGTAVKIMRRTVLAGNKLSNDGSTAASSSVPSKATSEAGAENTSDEGLPSPPDTTSSRNRSKLTREEKEAQYKAARERIFRDFQEAQGNENATADNSANMSRSSSSSGKKKAHKQKAPKDDSFEGRSSYGPGFPGMPYTSQTQYPGSGSASGHQSPYGAHTPNPMSTMNFASNSVPMYNQYDPSATFQGTNFPVAYQNQYGSNDGWPNAQSTPPTGYYNFMQQPGPSYTAYGSPVSSPTSQYTQIASPGYQSPSQQWVQPQYQQPYQAQPPMQPLMGQNGGPVSWPGFPPHPFPPNPGSPYQFGQAPFQQYSSTPQPNSHHPLPGSYNRPVFNPQIRSFVPAGPSMRFGPQHGQTRPMHSFSVQGGGSNSSQNTEKPDSPARATSAPNSKTQESLQKKWGTPAHLPKKPPPSQVPFTFEIENTPPLPSQQPSSFPALASSIAKGSLSSVGNN